MKQLVAYLMHLYVDITLAGDKVRLLVKVRRDVKGK